MVSTVLLILPVMAFAHQPRLVMGELDEPVEIFNPEVSQAFYAELEGAPEYYVIRADEPFNFYLSMTVADEPGVDTDYVVRATQDSAPVITLDGTAHEWTEFHEEFAGDDYLNGPEQEMAVEAGEYLIEVSSPDNSGKYVLVVGKKESFPFGESVKMFKVLPDLKKDFFNKSGWAIFEGLIVRGLAIFGGIIILLIVFIIWWIKKRKK